jgi:hypothetical protein
LNILELTGWPLCSPYKSCSWGHGGRRHGWAQRQTLILVNPKPIINMFSLLKLQHGRPNMIRILTMHQLVNIYNIKHFHPQVKIGYNGSFHEPSFTPIQILSTQVVWGKKLVVQTTMAFISEQDYDQLHIDDGIYIPMMAL